MSRPGPGEDLGRIAGYRLTGLLGEGGQGAVYLGLDQHGRAVAIKVLHARMSEEPEARRRFFRQVELARRVAPFCTARVLDMGMHGDRPYIVSEYVRGDSLERVVRTDGPRTGGGLERLAVATTTALAAIHRAGVVHRDLKPGNVILGPEGPVVIDFGISRALDHAVTQTGAVGTPGYMAPEQVTMQEIGPATDVFSWGATMVYAATGRRAFPGDSVAAILRALLYDEPDVYGVPEPLRTLVLSCLAKNPAQRPTADSLTHTLTGRTTFTTAPLTPTIPVPDTPSPASPWPGGDVVAGTLPAAGTVPAPEAGGGPLPGPGAAAAEEEGEAEAGPQTAPGIAGATAPRSPAETGPGRGVASGAGAGAEAAVEPAGTIPEPRAGSGAGPEQRTGRGAGSGLEAGRSTVAGQGVEGRGLESRAAGGFAGVRWWVPGRALVAGGVAVCVVVAVLVVAMWPRERGPAIVPMLATTPTGVPALGADIGQPLAGHANDVRAVAVGSFDGTPAVLTGSDDETARLWDPRASTEIGEPLTGHTEWVRSVALDQLDGRPIAVTASDDGTARVWDLRTGRARTLKGHAGDVKGVATGRIGGRHVAVTASADGTARVWDLRTARQTGAPLAGHKGAVWAVAVGQVGGTAIAVTTGDDKSVRMWDLATGRQLGAPMTGHTGWVRSVALGQVDGVPVAITGSEDMTVRVWDLSTRKPFGAPLTGHTNWVWSVAISNLGDVPVAVTGSEDGTARVWDLRTRKQLGAPYTGHTDCVWSVAIGLLDGRPVAVTGSRDQTARVWSLGPPPN